MICYCIRNKTNNKKYIGITNNFEKRMNSHRFSIKNKESNLLYNSIRKYGWENFEIGTIDYSGLVTYKELKEIEIDMISKYNTYYKWGSGYNMTLGGDGGDRSKQIIQYDKNSLEIINYFNSIKSASLVTGINISGIGKNCRGEQKSSGGYIWSFKENIPKKYNNKKIRSVYQFDRNTLELINIFDSIVKAEKETGILNISACCLGKQKSAGNFKWSYDPNQPIHKYENKKIKQVFQFNKNKQLINEYKSIKEASEKSGIGYYSIQSSCSGRQKTGGGFYWSFKENISWI